MLAPFMSQAKHRRSCSSYSAFSSYGSQPNDFCLRAVFCLLISSTGVAFYTSATGIEDLGGKLILWFYFKRLSIFVKTDEKLFYPYNKNVLL